MGTTVIEMRKMLNIEEVLALIPVSRSTLERMERENKFPAGHLIRGRKVWYENELAEWQNNLPRGNRPYSSRRKKG